MSNWCFNSSAIMPAVTAPNSLPSDRNQRPFILARGADGMFELNFLLFQRDVELVLQLVGDHAGRDGAEQLAFLAGLDLDDTDQFGDALGEFGHGVELVR